MPKSLGELAIVEDKVRDGALIRHPVKPVGLGSVER
jgi:hypothetical protein